MKKSLYLLLFSILTTLVAEGLPQIKYKQEKYKILNEKESEELRYIISSLNNEKLEKYLKSGVNPNSFIYGKFNFSLLQFAASNQNIEGLKLLFKYGADANIISPNYFIPLVLSEILTYQFSDFSNEINILIENGANLNLKTESYQKIICNSSSIIRAPITYARTKKMIEFLVSKGAEIEQKSADGRTILDYISISKPKIKPWLIDNYNLPKVYFKCGSKRTKQIIKVIHTKNGYKEFDENDILVYEFKDGKKLNP
ncbi:MAG: hypothetical protein GY932_08755 [Arcobacter sp.]|nr:hypothetical protein [Arcobacter sp.]